MITREQFIQEYEKKLNDLYVGANTKSKKKRIVYDLFHFSEMCYEHFEMDKEFVWESDEEMISYLEDISDSFIYNIVSNKNMYGDISKSVVNTFLEVKYPFYKDYGKLLYYIPKKEMDEIIYAFLNSYDPSLVKKYKDMENNSKIFNIDISYGGYAGLCYPMSFLKQSFIFHSDPADSIGHASTLIHEFGHSYEYDVHYTTGSDTWVDGINKRAYCEVSSRFFEYAFFRYLEENRIYYNDAELCLLNYYITMFEHIYNIHLICEKESLDVNKYGYVELNEAKLVEYASILKNELNYHILPSEFGNEINFRYAFLYGLGSLLSIYLYDSYKQNSDYFKKEFKNALINYQYNGIDAFKNVGVTYEELIKGDVLKRVLKNSR